MDTFSFDSDIAVLIDALEAESRFRNALSFRGESRGKATTISRHHVFVSYARADQTYVDKLVKGFAQRKINYWIDKDIAYGDRWAREIDRQLSGAIAVVIVMTPAAEESVWVERELQHAESLTLPILPLLLLGKRWLRLRNLQDVDVRSGTLPPEDWFTRLQVLRLRS